MSIALAKKKCTVERAYGRVQILLQHFYNTSALSSPPYIYYCIMSLLSFIQQDR